jgi:hypothetical protein
LPACGQQIDRAGSSSAPHSGRRIRVASGRISGEADHRHCCEHRGVATHHGGIIDARLRQQRVAQYVRESSTQQITRETLRALRASHIFSLFVGAPPPDDAFIARSQIVGDIRRNSFFSHIAFDQSVSINCRMLVLIG